jgi:hypothetical protein
MSVAGSECAIKFAAMLTACMLSVAALAQQGGGAPGGTARDISGVWWVTKYSPNLEIEGGGDIPYNAKGRAAYQRNVAGLKDGSIVDKARTVCVPDGIPRILGNPYPFMIIQTPDQTTVIYELNQVFRVIGMDQEQLSTEDLEVTPYYSGHSVGHWEGDTLVVETAGYNDKTFLDATGAPHSDEMTTVERIRKVNGKQLEDAITVTDPEYLTKPLSARFVYDLRPEVSLETYVCGEEHRDISHVPGVTEARRARRL